MESQSLGTLQSPSTFSESSRTGSSKSGTTVSKVTDQDFTKDNVTSPIDLECHIQAERITKILNEAIYKTKLAICLPNLVKEYRTLSSILSDEHMDDLVLIFEQYDSPLFSTSLLNMAAMEDLKAFADNINARDRERVKKKLKNCQLYLPRWHWCTQLLMDEVLVTVEWAKIHPKILSPNYTNGLAELLSALLSPTYLPIQGDISLKNRLNPELGLLLYIMGSYPALKPVINEMVDEMKSEAQEGKNQISPGLKYLIAFENFRDLMIKQMDTTAAEELAIKMKTRKLEASNEKLIQKIEEYSQTLKEETEHFEETMKVKADIIANLEKELAAQNHEATIKLQKKILDSERQMVLTTRAHLVKNEMLKEEENESKESYEQLLKAHLADEKNQRARRLKVETQLLSWLQKYDQEMGDKQKELDEFTEKYEDELKKCEELELELAEQDKEYIPLMAERDAEYDREMAEKMNKFLLEHAARVIQNAWREVLANRAEKKRLKKLQKKMQTAVAAAKKSPKK